MRLFTATHALLSAIFCVALVASLAGCGPDTAADSNGTHPVGGTTDSAAGVPPHLHPAANVRIDGQMVLQKWLAGQPEIPSNLEAVALWQVGADMSKAAGTGWIGCDGIEKLMFKSAGSSSIKGIEQVEFFGKQFASSGCRLADPGKLMAAVTGALEKSLILHKQTAGEGEVKAAAAALVDPLPVNPPVNPPASNASTARAVSPASSSTVTGPTGH